MKTRLQGLALAAGISLLAVAHVRAEPDKPGLGGEVQAEVAEVRPQNLIRLDRGAAAGVKERQVFEIFQETKAYSLPLSGGAKLRVNRSVVARAVVVEVSADSCLAVVFDGSDKSKVEPHAVAVLNQGIAPPDLPPRIRGHKPIHPSPRTNVPWRITVQVTLDVELARGRSAYYEWRTPKGGSFSSGVEVAPGVVRTVVPEIGWVAPIRAAVYPINVTVTDSTGQTAAYMLELESIGPRQERAANPHVLRTLFTQLKFDGLRDVGFDARGNTFWLDGAPGLRSDEFLHGATADGADLGVAKVTNGDFAAMAVSEDALYFLDVKETCVKRYARTGPLSSILSADMSRIGEAGSGTGRFKNPVDLALLPDGGLVVLDEDQHCVHRYDADGHFMYSFGRSGNGEHDLGDPVALAVARDGTVYVLDNGRKRVVTFKDGHCDSPDIEVGVASEDLRGIAMDPAGVAFALVERNAGAVKVFTQTKDGWNNTARSASGGSDDVAFMKKPSRIRVSPIRLAWVIDRDGSSFARFDVASNADFTGRLGAVELSDSVRLAASADSDVVALDRSKKVAIRFDRQGWATAKMGFDGSQGGELKTPVGVGIDGDQNTYVVDAKRFEIEKYQGKGGGWLKAMGSEAVFDKIRYGQMSSQRERVIVLMTGDNQRIGVVDPQTGNLEPRALTSGDLDDLELATFAGRFDQAAPKDEEGYFWIVDKSGERVSRFTLRNLTPVEITQSFKKVTGMCANPAGAVFLCDRKTKSIEVYAANGVKLGSIQDDQIEGPLDVATDDLGHLYVFDESKVRILELGE
jgi:streptogramin lyase